MKTLEKIKVINLSGREIEVKKLPLSKIVKVLSEIAGLKELLGEIEGKKNSEVAGMIPSLLAKYLPDLASALVKASNADISEEFLLNECGLEDVLDLWDAISEVNNFGKLKKYFGGSKKKVEA